MRANRMVLFLIVLALMASTCQAQLLGRRMGRAVGQITLDAGTRLFDQAVHKVIEDPVGTLKNVRVSVKLSADIQKDPQAKQQGAAVDKRAAQIAAERALDKPKKAAAPPTPGKVKNVPHQRPSTEFGRRP